MLKQIFDDKLVGYEREPVLLYGDYGLLLPSMEFYNQLTTVSTVNIR